MTSWLVFSESGQHLGPVPTEYVARAIKSGAIPANRWITEVGRASWRPAAEVPEVRAMLESMSGGNPRERDHTMVAPAEAFPSFPPAPSTQKDVPSSGDTINSESSERTLIAPAAFPDEYATIAEPPRVMPAHNPDLDTTLQQKLPQPALRASPQPVPIDQGFNETLRSREQGMLPRPSPAMAEAETLTAPGQQWPGRAPPPKAPVVEHIVNPAVAARQTPLPRTPSASPPAAAPIQARVSRPSPAMRESSSRDAAGGSGGSVLAFFLGGLALGAIVVVLALVWAFRGGLLR